LTWKHSQFRRSISSTAHYQVSIGERTTIQLWKFSTTQLESHNSNQWQISLEVM